MKKILFILIFILLWIAQIQSQNIFLQTPPGYNFIYEENKLPKNVEGSPYLNDWEKAIIVLKSGSSTIELPVRLDIYYNKVLYQFDNKTYYVGSMDSIAEIRFQNRTLYYKNFGLGKSFFELVSEGKASLYIKYEIEVIGSNYNVAMNVGNKNDKLVLKQKYFIQKDNQMFLIAKKNHLLDALQDKKEEVEAFIKNEKLNIKNIVDLKKVVSFYNQL